MLVFNGIMYVVMMVLLVDLEDFVLGFVLFEGIIDSCVDWCGVDVEMYLYGFEVYVEIVLYCFVWLKECCCVLVGLIGCGLCGIESL